MSGTQALLSMVLRKVRTNVRANWNQLFITLALGLTYLSVSGQSAPGSDIRDHYADSLARTVELFEMRKQPSHDLVEFIIPETQEEALLFFDLDLHNTTSDEFAMIDNLIVLYCKKGDKPIFKKYMIHSSFVDGYFAEDYLISIKKILSVQKKLFCELLKTLPSSETEVLSTELGENCNE